MEITVQRYADDDQKTRSLVFIDGVFECYGLEDTFHENKIPDQTRISEGTYRVGLRSAGSIHPKYLQRFPDDHKGMLHILDVPEFEWIYIHIGNTQFHTSGCLLVGAGVSTSGALQSSELAYWNLYKKVVKAAEGAALTITFIDGDR